MPTVLESLVLEHDPTLVLLAAVICVVGASATMSLTGRVSEKRHTFPWLLVVSGCAGATVWSTHFIAVLAYRTGMPMTYAPGLTILSFLSGTLLMGCGFGIAMQGQGRRLWARLGGMTVGIGVVVLHYIGMAAIRLPGHLLYAPELVTVSILLSLGFGAFSLSKAFGASSSSSKWVNVTFMVVMIVSLHFTAMGAVHVGHDTAAVAPSGGVSRSVLATAVAVASLLVLVFALVGAFLDQKVSQRLAAEADRFRTLSDGAFEGLVVHRDGVIVDANAAARRMFGLTDALDGPFMGAWLPKGCAGTWGDGPVDERDGTAETILRRVGGGMFPAEICRRRILLSDGTEAELLAIRDLTARKESEARIAHLGLHDTLTGLPNRRFFMEMAQQRISLAQRPGERLAVLAVDLDNLKIVNGMHGHGAGDEVIRVATGRIRAALRDEDFCARFGGDEFAILQAGVPSPLQAVTLGDRLLERLREPVKVQGAEVSISASIGVAFHPEDGQTVDELLRNAYTAMGRAKADGKSTLRFFELQMDAALIARRRLERGLRSAVTEGRLTLAYQPIVDSNSRVPVAFEALVRWTDSELGVIAPAEFIPVAEETGLIIPIGEFVLSAACREAVRWPEPLRVAINLSAVQFRRQGLVDAVKKALEQSGLPGERVELEVTETLLIENRDEALRTLRQLKALGILISMDDFGTGYSSLRYLQSFPFDKIKIDQSFVADLPNNAQNASIVRAIAAMGKSLDMRVVAEGVETGRQADLLEGFECDELQGFLIAEPMTCAEIDSFLAGHPSLRLEAGVPVVA